MRIRSGNRRRRRAHSIAEAKRIRRQRLDKLWRLTRRQLIKAVVRHLEDQILNGSGNLAGGGIVSQTPISEMSLVDHDSYPWGGGPRFEIVKNAG